MENSSRKSSFIIEPFYGGSHKVLVDVLTKYLDEHNLPYTLITLPDKKWHWRARCGALQMYQKIPKVVNEKVLWCSSVLSLSELLGLRSDLQKLRKVVYFHENQLIYPVQEIKSRDIQYAYNQITTCLAADVLLFNSAFNMDSFIDNISKVLKLLPDNKPKNIKTEIHEKSRVLYFPVSFSQIITSNKRTDSMLHIVWPHRWEFDKGPEEFFSVVMQLKRNNLKFKLSVLGETYSEVPAIFSKAREDLSDEIIHFGFLENKNQYFDVLSSSHVVLSTAKHEFFGVSVLEAVYCGCLPLLPNRLVYPELYPITCLYSNMNELFKILEKLCLKPEQAVKLRQNLDIDFSKFSAEYLIPQYIDVMNLTE